ncbi:hypothetical protein GJ496_002770 [Pomphorhynchus laevis]|nr:hypothetical protein GJ496_002770 [Pomphorhynchus laevis]
MQVDVPVILIWTPNKYTPPHESLLSVNNQQKCIVTHNKDDLSKSKSVVLHLNEIVAASGVRIGGYPAVLLMFEETPLTFIHMGAGKSRFQTVFLNNFINWTMSYRTDSTITIKKYHRYRTNLGDKSDKLSSKISRFSHKNGRMIAVLSNCKRKLRNDFIKNMLRVYPDLDLFGKCGLKLCGRNQKECNELISTYSFYLAIENSFECQDYITEKYWRNALENYVLPVVKGAKIYDYKKLAIPNSYLHVDNFTNLESLSLFLKHLIINRDAYFDMVFGWRKQWQVKYDYSHWSRLCEKLYSGEVDEHVYSNFDFYFNSCPDIWV